MFIFLYVYEPIQKGVKVPCQSVTIVTSGDGITMGEAGLPLTLRGGGPRGGHNGSLALSALLPFTLAPLCTSREPVHICVGIEPAHSHICSCALGVQLHGPV